MKKFLSVFLSISLTLTLFITSSALAASQSFDFSDVTELPTSRPSSDGVWYAEGSNSAIGISVSDEKVKIESNEADNGYGKYLKIINSCNATGEVIMSFDFMMENDFEGSSVFAVAVKSSGASSTWLEPPAALPSKDLAANTWYKATYVFDCRSMVSHTYISDSEFTITVAENSPLSSANSGITKIDGIGVVELQPNLKGVTYVDNISFETTDGVAITNIKDGQTINVSEPLSLEGTLAKGTTSAKIMIDDTVIYTFDTLSSPFSISADVSSLVYGSAELVLEAEVSGKVKRDSIDIILSDNVHNILADSFTGSKMTFDSITMHTDNPLYNYSVESAYADGAITLKLKDGYNQGTRRLTFDFAPALTKGVLSVKFDAAFSSTAANMYLESREGSSYPFSNIYLLNNSALMGAANGEKITAGVPYTFEVIVDAVAKTYTVKIEDEIVINAAKFNVSNGLTSLYFDFSPGETLATAVLSDFMLTQTLPLPTVSDVGYTNISGTETMTGKTMGAQISSLASSMVVAMSDSLDSDCAPQVTLTNGAQAVDADISLLGNKLYITPASGFELGASYTAQINGLKYSGKEYAKALYVSFDAVEPKFEFVSPLEAEVFEQKDITLAATAPTDYENIALSVDGEEYPITETKEGLYETSISYDALNLGMHKAVLTASANGKVKTVSTSFETTAWLTKTEFTYDNVPKTNATITQTTGSDGSENGGFVLCDGNGAYFNVSGAFDNAYADDIKLSFDIKREENSVLQFEVAQWYSSGSKYDYVGTKNLISSGGALAGTSTVLKAGVWYNLEIITNLSAKTTSVYLDGKLIKEGTDSGITNNFEKLTAFKIQEDGSGSLSFDNFYAGKNTVNPRLTSLAYSTDGAEFVESADNVISSLTKAVKITTDNAYDASCITAQNITVGGTAAESVALDIADSTGRTIIVSFANAPDTNTAYAIELSGSMSYLENPLSKAYGIRVETNGDTVDCVGDIIFTEADGQKNASVTIVKASSDSALADSAVLVVASYDGSKMTELDISEIQTLEAGGKYTLTASVAAESPDIKAFLLESFTTMKPVKK